MNMVTKEFILEKAKEYCDALNFVDPYDYDCAMKDYVAGFNEALRQFQSESLKNEKDNSII